MYACSRPCATTMCLIRFTCLLLGAATLVAASSKSLQHLRRQRSLLFHHEDKIDCLYIRGDILFEDDKSATTVLDGCEINKTIYHVPEGLLDGFRSDLKSGVSRIEIVGAEISEGGLVITGQSPVVTVYEPVESRLGYSIIQNNHLRTVGTRTVLLVRVTSQDAQVSLRASQISESAFSTPVHFASQMNLCSGGALEFVPAQGPNIQDGVGEMYIDVVSSNVAAINLHGALQEQFQALFGNETGYDHILYCLPQGTFEKSREWIAYAYQDTSFSYYYNEWCGSLTAKMHELGHNLGLGHSGTAEGDYEDYTCIMGASFISSEGPQKCFNGWRHWSFGWFGSHQITVTPPWRGNLVAFVDSPREGDYVIVNVANLYLQYNAAKKHNSQVGAHENQVTVVQAGESPGSVSTLLAGLDANYSSHTIQPEGTVLTIQFCGQGSYDDDDVDYVRIVIYEGYEAPVACATTSRPPTISPTTISPSPPPTVSPSPPPTINPSPRPTISPSVSPSVSQSPSDEPSFNPSQLPSTSSAPSESPSLSLAPSTSSAPSYAPSISTKPSQAPSVSSAPSTSSSPSHVPSVSPNPSPAPSAFSAPSQKPTLEPTPVRTQKPTEKLDQTDKTEIPLPNKNDPACDPDFDHHGCR